MKTNTIRLQTITQAFLQAFTKHNAVPLTVQTEAAQMLQAAQLALTACHTSAVGDCVDSATLQKVEKELTPFIARLQRQVERENKVLIKTIEKRRKAEHGLFGTNRPITVNDLNRARYELKQQQLMEQAEALRRETLQEPDIKKAEVLHQQVRAIFKQVEEMMSGTIMQ